MENQFSIETLVNVYSRNLINDVWTFQSISKYIYFLRDILRYSLVLILIDNTHILNTKSLFQELETHFCLLHKNLVKLVLSLYVSYMFLYFLILCFWVFHLKIGISPSLRLRRSCQRQSAGIVTSHPLMKYWANFLPAPFEFREFFDNHRSSCLTLSERQDNPLRAAVFGPKLPVFSW